MLNVLRKRNLIKDNDIILTEGIGYVKNNNIILNQKFFPMKQIEGCMQSFNSIHLPKDTLKQYDLNWIKKYILNFSTKDISFI